MTTPIISAICCTYGRFTILNRAIACFIRQTFPQKELVIFNTAPVPLMLSEELQKRGDIVLVNQPNCSATNWKFANIGQIRRDAMGWCRGEVYKCYDDDDLYLPFDFEQGFHELNRIEKVQAWKPAKSLYSKDGGMTFELAGNYMEASVFVRSDAIRRIGFDFKSGSEHLRWYDALNSRGQLAEDPTGIPAYAFCWGEPLAPHKQSGDINNPNNFENHKAASTDFGEGKVLDGKYDIDIYFERIKKQFPYIAKWGFKE